MRVAYLEDDAALAALVLSWLEAAGHTCHHFARARPLQLELPRESFDMFLLDWHLPDLDGLKVLQSIRARAPRMPVIFVTARDSEEDVSRVLKAGADDYISKPVRRTELLARMEAVARRVHGDEDAERVEVAPFIIDRKARRILRDGQPIELTDKEYELAAFLLQQVGRLLSRQHLLETVWGMPADTGSRTVDTHVSRLRTKLSLTADFGWKLASVHQFGYRLERLQPQP